MNKVRIKLVGGSNDGGEMMMQDTVACICVEAGKSKATSEKLYDLYSLPVSASGIPAVDAKGTYVYVFAGRFNQQECEKRGYGKAQKYNPTTDGQPSPYPKAVDPQDPLEPPH